MGVGRWHNTMMVHFSTQGFWDADYYYEPFHCTQNNNIRGTIRGTTCHLHTGNGNIWLEIPVGFVNRYDCGVVLQTQIRLCPGCPGCQGHVNRSNKTLSMVNRLIT